jgi:hypothetical protein
LLGDLLAWRRATNGHVVLHDPGDEAAWLKERLARAKQTNAWSR